MCSLKNEFSTVAGHLRRRFDENPLKPCLWCGKVNKWRQRQGKSSILNYLKRKCVISHTNESERQRDWWKWFCYNWTANSGHLFSVLIPEVHPWLAAGSFSPMSCEPQDTSCAAKISWGRTFGSKLIKGLKTSKKRNAWILSWMVKKWGLTVLGKYCWWFRNPKANHLGWC